MCIRDRFKCMIAWSVHFLFIFAKSRIPESRSKPSWAFHLVETRSDIRLRSLAGFEANEISYVWGLPTLIMTVVYQPGEIDFRCLNQAKDDRSYFGHTQYWLRAFVISVLYRTRLCCSIFCEQCRRGSDWVRAKLHHSRPLFQEKLAFGRTEF